MVTVLTVGNVIGSLLVGFKTRNRPEQKFKLLNVRGAFLFKNYWATVAKTI